MSKVIDILLGVIALALVFIARALGKKPAPVEEEKVNADVEQPPLDLDMVTHQCVCGSVVWKILVAFNDYELAWYSLPMYCASCGAKAIAPTPLDRPEASGF